MNSLDVNFGRFNNSINFIFGLTTIGGTFDILNNPYVDFLGLELTEGEAHMVREKYELGICPASHMEKFMKPHSVGWYEQPLCFKDRDNVTIKNNWFMRGHAFPVIAIAYCKNTTENGNWCKSWDETDEMLRTHPAYFAHQVTRVESKIFSDSPEIEGFPYYGDDENYFPTLATMTSYNFGPIEVDPAKRAGFVQHEEISWMLEKISIDDSHILDTARETEVLNVGKTREAIESNHLWIFLDESEERHLIKTKAIVMMDLAKQHTRSFTSTLSELAEIGGLAEFLYIFAYFGYHYFGRPYRELDLGIHFNKMISKMKKRKDLVAFATE